MKRKIVLFGTGKYSEKISSVIKKVDYYVDNSRDKSFFFGKDVYPFEKLLTELKSDILVIIASTFYDQIKNQLISAGFEYEKHFIEYERFFELYPEFLCEVYEDVIFGNNVQLIGINTIKIGQGSILADNVWVNDSIRNNNFEINIGKHCNIGRGSQISAANTIEIGDYGLLAPNVYISNVNHNYSDISTPIVYQPCKDLGELIIEENVWIGTNACIMGNISIGRGSVIGANSMVFSSIPPFSVVVGSPAKVIKLYNPKTLLWERIETEEQEKRILLDRENFLLPSRKQYKDILAKSSEKKELNPILAGKGRSI